MCLILVFFFFDITKYYEILNRGNYIVQKIICCPILAKKFSFKQQSYKTFLNIVATQAQSRN